MSVREDIKAYIDGELSRERAEEVRQAIASDPEINAEYLAMKEMTEQIAAMVRQPQVKGATKALETARPKRRSRFWEIVLATGLCAIVAAVLFPVFSQSKMAAKKTNMPYPASEHAGSAADSDLQGRSDERLSSKLKEESEEALPTDDGLAFEGGANRAARTLNAPELAQKDAMPGAAGAKAMLDSPQEAMDREAAMRLVIKDASFTVEVDNVKEVVDASTNLAKSLRGYVEGTSISDSERGAQSMAYVTIRVPQARFEEAVSSIRKYGEVKSENTSGEDVTAQVADIQARVNTLKAEEETLRNILRQAKKVGEVIEINDRISQVRQQIESYDAQRVTLSRLASLSTISLTFVQAKTVDDEPVPEDWFDETKVSAVLLLKGIGKFVAQAATYLFVLSPVWVPALLLVRYLRRRRLVPVP